MPRLTLILILGCLSYNICQAQVTKIASNLRPVFTAILPPSSGTGNATVIFAEESGKIWVSDGTPINTYPLTVPVTLTDGVATIVFQNKLYFTGLSETGRELWVTDGTAPGTRLVKDIWEGTGSSRPYYFFKYKNRFVFSASDSISGEQLWITDGTGPGTVVLAPSGSLGYYAILHDELYFTPAFACGGRSHPCANAELWKTDGTTAGTQKIAFLGQMFRYYKPEFLFTWKDHIYFQGGGQEYGFQLWISDGTTAGTHVLKPSANDGVMEPDKPATLGDKLVFRAAYQLWATDGTAAGTLLIDSLEPGFNSSYRDAVVINQQLLYAALNGDNGYEIHETDGTKDGTRLFSKLVDNATWRNISFWVPPGDYLAQKDTIRDFSDRLFKGKAFITIWYDVDGSTIAELWSTDGTNENTKKVHRFFDYSGSYFFNDSIIYFVDKNQNGRSNIYTTDGSPGSAQLFATGFYSTQFLFKVNGKIFLTANDNAPGVFVIEDKPGVLPAKPLAFTANSMTDMVRLHWETTNDFNVRQFEVERSIDGRSFMSIAILNKENNNPVYTFDDKTAYTQNARTIFYRLKLVGNNQETSYSNIEKVLLPNDHHALSITPNPVRDFMQVRYTTQLNQRIILTIYNTNGSMIKSYQLPAANGYHQQQVNVADLPKGMYYLKVSSDASLNISFIKE